MMIDSKKKKRPFMTRHDSKKYDNLLLQEHHLFKETKQIRLYNPLNERVC